MLVLIDNSGDEKIFFYWREKNKIISRSSATARPLLAALGSALAKSKKKISDLTGVAIVTGRGRFTASRVAATTANALGYALGVPVVAIDGADFDKAEKILKTKRAGVYVSAKYSGEAHINGKQKK